MKTKEINFIDSEQTVTQQTILRVLRDFDYDFEPVNEYDNNMFYCNIYKDVENRLKYYCNRYLGTKFKTTKRRVATKLIISTSYYGDFYVNNPIVFTQNDVKNIVLESPARYIGNMEL